MAVRIEIRYRQPMLGSLFLQRRIGQLEGASFLLLLFVAMPLKYFADMPLAVRVVGMAHGVLFILYLLVLFTAAYAHQWPRGRTALGVLAAFAPFGPFLFDAYVRAQSS